VCAPSGGPLPHETDGVPAWQTPDLSAFRSAGTSAALRAGLGPHLDEDVRFYVVRTVELVDGALRQRGSGPNLEGGVVTLCTCKHRMRTSRRLHPGSWVAGFTSRTLDLPGQALFYLARVEACSTSHADHWLALPPEVRAAKIMSRNPLGDVFEPIDPASTPPDAGLEAYRFVPVHAHGTWTGGPLDARSRALAADLRHVGRGGSVAKLLRFDPGRTWVWERPTLYRPGSLGIGERVARLGDLVASLIDEQEPA
jgi:hypothetical protein